LKKGSRQRTGSGEGKKRRKQKPVAKTKLTKLLSLIPRYALFTLLIFTPLARGSVQGWAITVIHMVTLIALTAILLEKNIAGNWKWIATPLDKPILILIILAILSTFFSLHKQTSFWSTILLFNYLIIYYLVIHTIDTRTRFKQLIYLIIGIATFLSIFGMLKRTGLNPFPWWNYTDLKSSIISSTYGNRNHMAGYLEMSIPLIMGLFLIGFRNIKIAFMLCLTLLFFSTLIFSYSRGGWLGTLTGLILMASVLLTNRYFSKKKLIAALTAGFTVIALIVLSSTPVVERILTFEQSIDMPNHIGRIRVWEEVNKMIKDHPLLGTGPGTFATIFTQYQPPGTTRHFTMAHNDYLHFTAEVGFPLIALIVWITIVLFVKGFNKMKSPSRLVRGITLGAMSGITAILIHSITDFNLHIPANALLFTVLAAMVVAPEPEQN